MAVEDVPPVAGDVGSHLESTGGDRPPVEEYAALAQALETRLEGEVAFDEYAQLLYATDGSIYQARPAGVAHPTDVDDVRAAVETAAEFDVPILPRGAGSSLAGQAVGPGCLVLDFTTHMDDVLEVDPDGRRAVVQPGVVQDHLDARLEPHGLKFAPDPASSNRATIGGGIGNNSTGAHSVRYGITDAYVEECEVVLADGSLLHAREVVLDGPEWDEIVAKDDREARIYETVRGVVEDHEAEIEARYPDLKRSVSGYNLQKVIYETDDGERAINLSKLLVGAEGTLGIVVEATLSLVTVPEETALVVYSFSDLIDALAAVPRALAHAVSAVELMDDEVFRLARESEGYATYAEALPEEAAAALMLEFDSEIVEDFEDAIAKTTAEFVDDGDAFDAVEAYTDDAQGDLWKLRKAAIPLLMSMDGDPKPYPFIEDASVPPAELATYVRRFEEILRDHGTSAAYFAHAGAGTLHIRPILNLKEEDGVETMQAITEDVTDLVLEHDGAFSGEHGDGKARTAFTPKMYGEDLWAAFKETKTAFDPEWRLHPGNVVYRDGPNDVGPDTERGVGADMRENLRYGPAYRSIEPRSTLSFDDEGGFAHLVELCNGCGTCRQTDSDVMCPTYRASGEEIQTTRGRANLLRAAISGELPPEELYSERFQSEVLDLCVGCKGCSSDCPTGVDLAKLKAAVKHQYHQDQGASLRTKLFTNIDRLAALASAVAPVSNRVPDLPGVRPVMERTLGIARDRHLPSFERETFHDWWDERGGPAVPESDAEAAVVLFSDTFTTYSEPGPGKAAVRLLEAAGVHVRVPTDLAPSGRAAYSMGLLEEARNRAKRNVRALAPYADRGWSVVFVEPSDAVMFQDEYRDLLADGANVDSRALEAVSSAAFGVLEYVERAGLDRELEFDAPGESLTYHGHCNQKAQGTDHHAVGVLRRAGYAVDPLDSTCCGMAGSFGYEAEHYDLSVAIGNLLADQVEASPGDRVTATGTSCRSQLVQVLAGEGEDDDEMERPPHPVELVEQARLE
ncbi:FAD-binding and (Fe-S)-binding domain-containing protein [Natronosalvus rutilus]|uniref:FAD-binding protein n=1 Tax=Natronosalvus rutilus TaxID=2953753 RepID=A0A9E7SVQ7_9EURY|nr:FAD-binding and (Fe-S)-binding domain-containing protein [Natronosalvus rutilus]UTF54715.1 FAD-binding protein [Natronosalvus rutilus]